MYFDTKPCTVCGAEVTLRSRETPPAADATGVVGVVGTADATVDERVCTNADCPTNSGNEGAPTP